MDNLNTNRRDNTFGSDQFTLTSTSQMDQRPLILEKDIEEMKKRMLVLKNARK